MNKLTLAMNAWRAFSVARRTEGSSLRGMIMGGASIAAVVAITLLRGDLTAVDVGIIATGISGLDAVLKYFIPDKLGQANHRDDLPPIDLIAESQAGGADADFGDGRSRPDPAADQLRQSVPAGSHPDPSRPVADDCPGFNG